MKLPTRETKAHLEAFEVYYTMGAQRSYQKVATKYGKSRPWVEAVAKAFHWKKRVDERDHAVHEESMDNFDELLIKAKKENLQIIRAMKISLAEEMKKFQKEGKTFKVTPADFERVAKLELLMLGDPTERISDDTITGLVKDAEEYLEKVKNKRGD